MIYPSQIYPQWIVAEIVTGGEMHTNSGSDGRAPLTPATFHILLALAGGERHGYGIMQEVTAITERRVRLGPGTLYRSIKALLADGLIEESSERPDPTLDDERRRYYRLTESGRAIAEAEAKRLAALVRIARSRQLLPDTAWLTGG
jgi:DNA-binding PadR family transcriptional regulator